MSPNILENVPGQIPETSTKSKYFQPIQDTLYPVADFTRPFG